MATSFAETLHDVAGAWGRPGDWPSQAAAGLAVALLLVAFTGRGRSLLGLGPFPVSRTLFLWITAFVAALLSIVYIAIYLRGGPRIVDATTYFLQGRALSHGDLAWPVSDPSASFRGRFLAYRESDGGAGTMGGIFPPGYPLLLAFGFGLGAPMVIGPALAAAIVIATYRLARTIAEETISPYGPQAARDLVEPVARTAALLSVVCGALRYHTADTMAHGATALGIALALDAALRRRVLLAGLLVGAVVATRPFSAIAIAVVVAFVALKDPRTTVRFVLTRLVLGLVPGVLLLVVAQHAVTGWWLTSSQRMYYALSDGPPGCFRWGFGKAGCLYEHGDFVTARLPHGFGVLPALGSTLRRLRMHLLDIANLEPLALLVLVPLFRARAPAASRPGVAPARSSAAPIALALVALHVLAHLPFYFDGNYPGGGARFFADILPVEHALIALAIARLAFGRYPRAAYLLLAASLAGFAVHASFGHRQLTERDGGRPMFEPDLLAKANITSGLVFVDTDHAFNLGHDPSAKPKNGVVVARLRNDDRDRLLFERLGQPTSYQYKFDAAPVQGGTQPPGPAVTPWAPAEVVQPFRFEAESEWPAIMQRGGFAMPAHSEACASNGRALVLTPTPVHGRATITIALPVPATGQYKVMIRVVQGTRLPFVATRPTSLAEVPKGTVRIGKESWGWVDIEGAHCADLPARLLDLTAPDMAMEMDAEGGAVALDRVLLQRVP